jgi:hypothetical protein
VALVLLIATESAFLVALDYIPAPAVEIAQRFTLTSTVSVHVPGRASATPLAITASLAGLLGLIIGGYLFLRNGLNGVLRFFNA